MRSLLRRTAPNLGTLQQDQPDEDEDDDRRTATTGGESRRRASALSSGKHFPQMSLALVPSGMEVDLRKSSLAKRHPHVAIHKAGQSIDSMRRSSCHMLESRLRRCGRGAVRAASVSTLCRSFLFFFVPRTSKGGQWNVVCTQSPRAKASSPSAHSNADADGSSSPRPTRGASFEELPV